MTRVSGAALAVFLMAGTAAYADPQDGGDFHDAAVKACNIALDRDRFNYSTMDECIEDQAAKLARLQKAAGAAPQSSAGAKASHPG